MKTIAWIIVIFVVFSLIYGAKTQKEMWERDIKGPFGKMMKDHPFITIIVILVILVILF